MWSTKAVDALNKAARPVTSALLGIGAVILAVMMLLTATDVVLRYVFNSPLPGVYELIEYMLGIMVPFGIVYCAHEKAHVAVDLLVGRFSERVQAVMGGITSLLAIGLFSLIAWQNVAYTREMFHSKLTSAVLLIPTYPFIAAVAIGSAVMCLILITDFLEFLRRAARK